MASFGQSRGQKPDPAKLILALTNEDDDADTRGVTLSEGEEEDDLDNDSIQFLRYI